ncbi:MAG: hypothetical protein JOY78_11225 [Pseudonocardia sp.]|nr:hypothetical protein [Pseudonocardia sp.]
MAAKVPAATAAFWILKIVTTGMGETASDWLARTIDPLIAVLGSGVALGALLLAQLLARAYQPWLYWGAVAMISVFGTMAADVTHVVLGVPYIASTLGFGLCVAALLAAWHTLEGTLAIHSITTTRRELFYWATVGATFALGTAAGDLTASTLGLGYLASGVLFAVAIAVPAPAHRLLGLDAVVSFWIAYVLTRPLGASFADWIAVPPGRGGLDLGTGPITLILLVALCVSVACLSIRSRNRPQGG